MLCLALTACEGAFFYPSAKLVRTPNDLGLSYREVWFESDDGLRLHGWFLPAAEGGEDGACSLLFLHGNAQNISTHLSSVAWLPTEGFNVFLFDYRGYGRSAGSPDIPGLHRDMAAALTTLFAMDEVDGGRVVVFGQSLGGAVAAVGLAASPYRQRVRALVIEGAFSSYREITREKLASLWLTWPLQGPLSLTVDDSYRPLEAIAEISPTPVLIVHGTGDRIVPSHHGEALFAAAGPPKDLWLVPGAGHLEVFADRNRRQRLARYLAARCG